MNLYRDIFLSFILISLGKHKVSASKLYSKTLTGCTKFDDEVDSIQAISVAECAVECSIGHCAGFLKRENECFLLKVCPSSCSSSDDVGWDVFCQEGKDEAYWNIVLV